MKEDFVTYDLAVKLKEKGFKEQCLAYYTKDSEFYYNLCYYLDVESLFISFNSSSIKNVCSRRIDAPIIAQVLKWLREEKKIHIDIGIWDCKYIPFIVYIDVLDENIVHTNKTVDVDDYKLFDTYEQAVIAGVEFVLNNLI